LLLFIIFAVIKTKKNLKKNITMKKSVLITTVIICITVLLFANKSYAQDIYTPNNDEVVMQHPSQVATYPGGITGIENFVISNYPNAVLNQYNGQTITVRFIIEKDGSIYSTEVLTDNCLSFAHAVKDNIGNMSLWTPAKDNGVVVRSYVDVPIAISTSQTTK
jgi:hypothetical protein